jgi:HPr kinase/phosphorylase
MHGIALEIFGRGIIITGKSGIGKSEIGLELIERGHKLICDDLVHTIKQEQQIKLQSPQEFATGFIEIRGLGFINIARLYGMQQICHEQQLFIIIQLVDNEFLDLINQDRLRQLIDTTDILGITIPIYQLPIGANRNLPILIELIVKYAIDCETGYNSHWNFIDSQTKFVQQEGDLCK